MKYRGRLLREGALLSSMLRSSGSADDKQSVLGDRSRLRNYTCAHKIDLPSAATTIEGVKQQVMESYRCKEEDMIMASAKAGLVHRGYPRRIVERILLPGDPEAPPVLLFMIPIFDGISE